ncbi:MAG TPA: hypothetical protein DEA47_03680 [Peptococcaceae bacterium]|nr:MAG: hypothetical protein XD50_0637 [Clostridia bacterium 41_269]HBT20451.1 hypothetical protein [Peptococcaceae bacterium]
MKQGLLKYAVQQGIVIGIGTFFLASIVSVSSQGLLKILGPLWLKLSLLVLIIALGVFFDIIGVAVAAANESSFRAKAARSILGAEQAVRLARNADRVASFCNDVVGDVCASLSGALGTAIVFELAPVALGDHPVVLGTLMTAIIAGLTVGGKALGKSIAIEFANDIIFRVGEVLAVVENTLGVRIIKNRSSGKNAVKRGRR